MPSQKLIPTLLLALLASLFLLWQGPLWLWVPLLLSLAGLAFYDETFSFLLLVLALVAGQLVRLTVGTISFPVLDLAVLVFVLAALLRGRAQLTKVFRSPLFRASLFLVLVFLLSWLFSLRQLALIEAWPGLFYLLRLTLYLLFLLLLAGKRELIEKSVSWSVGAISLLGLGQFFWLADLRLWERWGWDPHLNRLTSTFLDPNLLAGWLVLGLAALLFWRRLWLALLALAAFLLAWSRSGWVTLLAFAGALAILQRRFWPVLLASLALAATVAFLPPARERALDLWQRGATFQARLENLKEGVLIWRRSPWLGVGFNNLRFFRAEAGWPAGERSAAGLDNSFLFVLTTSGLIGFLTYLWFLVTLLRSLGSRPYLLAGAVALLVNSLFVNSLFYPPTLALLFLLAHAGNRKI